MYLSHHKKIIDHRWDDYEKEYICEITDCTGEPYWITENSLYPTKSQLIEAQIEYWGNLLGEELEQHVSDYCMPPFEGEIKGFNDSSHIQEKFCTRAKECQHESDGHFYYEGRIHDILPIGITIEKLMDHGMRNKCKKCGEFYR